MLRGAATNLHEWRFTRYSLAVERASKDKPTYQAMACSDTLKFGKLDKDGRLTLSAKDVGELAEIMNEATT